MKKIFFENAELFFQDFYIGILSGEIEFFGSSGYAVVEKFSKKSYGQVHSADIVLRFSLKEKSVDFQNLIQQNGQYPPEIKYLFSDFGTLKIKTAEGTFLKIKEALWTRFPHTEFQLKRNTENTIHTLYFLWER